MESDAAPYAHLPEHPEDPFLRIIGVALDRPQRPGDPCPWGLAFHVVFPTSPRPRRIVRARILSGESGKVVLELPKAVYPRGPCVSHIDLYDSRVLVDREVGDVFDVHSLPPGLYRAEADLVDEHNRVCAADSLVFEVAPLSFLKERIPLVCELWKRTPREARYLSGSALVGDVDGDGRSEYVHVISAVHMAVYRPGGELMWRYDDPDGAWGYGPSALVHDIDGDGKAEIICVRGAFGHVRLCMLEGATGRLIKEIEYPILNGLEAIPPDDPDLFGRLFQSGHAIRVVEGFHMIGGYVYPANFRGRSRNEDIMLQVGEQNCVTIVALNSDLEVLWQYRCDNGRAGHTPGIGDVDGDGCDEVALGTELIDHNGERIWELPFESFAAPWEDDHVDQGVIGDLDGDGETEIAYSSRLVVEAATGKRRWIDPTWHGQQARAERLRDDLPGLQLIFNDREYRHSRHFIHGSWLDVRDGRGKRLWDRRFMSMHPLTVLRWLPGDCGQICLCSDLQRFAPNPNLQIFDGYGTLVDVLPTVAHPHDTIDRIPPGQIIQHPFTPHPHGEIDVYGCGRQGKDHG